MHPIPLARVGSATQFPFEEVITAGLGFIDGVEAIYSMRSPHMEGQTSQSFCARDRRTINNICGGDQGSMFAVLDRGVFVLRNLVRCICQNVYLFVCSFGTVWHCIVPM